MKKYLVLLFLILVLSGGIAAIFAPKDFDAREEMVFQVEPGQGFKEIAENLEKEGLIWWSPFFKVYALASGKAKNLQAGSYFISPSMSIPRIVQKLASGDIASAKITFAEGFTSEQIYQKLKNIADVSKTALQAHEGYLFPDTYQIAYGASEEKIIKMMRDNFEKKTAGLEITPEIVIMASLLEKEVKTRQEKELAAGVLWKRLRAGIPLQVDAAPETYQRLGLPEKPICNPGLESLLAALHPQDSPYWYYLSKPDGVTIFQKTLDEHNAAKARYLRRRGASEQL